VEQQLERPELEEQLNERTRQLLSVKRPKRYLALKKSIAEFATTSQHPTIRRAKERFENEGQGAIDGVTWENHWSQLARDREWSDGLMVQATAWFTGHDIQLVMTTGTPEEPFRIIRGNLDDAEKDCPGHPLWIGYHNSIHYQSLLPTGEEVTYQQPDKVKQGNKIPRSQEVEAMERGHENKKLGDKIPTEIKKKQADQTEGGERGEGNKKPGDKIPTKIKKNQRATSQGVEGVDGEQEIKKPGNKIPAKIKEKQAARTKAVE
jgi:hypothetical protein